MKNLVLVSFCALFLTVIANAGIFRESAKVVKPAAKASAKVVKFSAKKASHVAKASGKAAKKIAY